MDNTMAIAADWTPSKWDLFWIYVRFTAFGILMITAFFCIAQLNGYNICQWFNKHPAISLLYSLMVVVSIVLFVADRNYYLPFLGDSVYPCGSLAEKIPANADTSITITTKPGANVIYWASEPTTPEKQPISNPWDAYAMYENSGVVRADSQGRAVLRFRSPSSYRVGMMNRKLNRHVHYRVCKMPGMLGEIKTVFV